MFAATVPPPSPPSLRSLRGDAEGFPIIVGRLINRLLILRKRILCLVLFYGGSGNRVSSRTRLEKQQQRQQQQQRTRYWKFQQKQKKIK